jgi:tetratricopeptide (TPR) repeat protein
MEFFFNITNLEKDKIEIPVDFCKEKVIAEEYNCIICLNIPINPRKCGECEKVICFSCYQKLSLQNNQCPYCKLKLNTKEFGKLENNVINALSIKCINNECNTYTSYQSIVEHIVTCKLTQREATCLSCKISIQTTNCYDELLTHIDTCEEILTLSSYNSEYSFNKGKIYFEMGEYTIALNCFEKALRINTKDDRCYYYKGRTLYELNKYQEAVECYDSAIEIFAGNYEYYHNKGLALKEMYEYKQALECSNKAIELNPLEDELFNSKGNLLRLLQDYKPAVECYNKAIQINPDIECYYYNKGLVLNELDKHNEAIECFNKAINLNPNDFDNLFMNGKTYHNLSIQNMTIAVEYYDKALKVKWNDPDLYFQKGNAFFTLGEYNNAIDCFDKAIELDSENEEYKDALSKLKLFLQNE